jgi:formiminotetrahydrofolate cyclodeaminase
MDKSLNELTINEFAGALGSGEPTPGGGAAAALESALGAALIMMVANHTIGKPKYAEFEELNKDVLAEAETIRGRLLEGVDKDAEAFGKVSAAYGMPRETDDEKAARTAAIATASVEAAEAPLTVMEDSAAALRLAGCMLGRSNANLKSDIYVAALSLQAGLKSASYNVDANLPAIERADADLAASMRERKAELINEADRLASEILEK